MDIDKDEAMDKETLRIITMYVQDMVRVVTMGLSDTVKASLLKALAKEAIFRLGPSTAKEYEREGDEENA